MNSHYHKLWHSKCPYLKEEGLEEVSDIDNDQDQDCWQVDGHDLAIKLFMVANIFVLNNKYAQL